MAIWWLATSKNEGHCSYDELKSRQVLAQGWPCIGNLEALIPVTDEGLFITRINQMVKCKYSHVERRNPGRIIKNLVSFEEGDLVLCTEGKAVKGIARVGANTEYRYDNGVVPNKYEYAQTMGPIVEWKDWNIRLAGNPPPTKAMGPVGIDHYRRDEQIIKDAWSRL